MVFEGATCNFDAPTRGIETRVHRAQGCAGAVSYELFNVQRLPVPQS